MKKLTFEYVKNYFKERGCELLEEEYKGCKIKMRYKCNCGEEYKTNFNKFKQGRRCKKCGYKKLANKFNHSYKYVKKYFKDNNCILLENTYINSHIKMKYQCSCKDKSIITFDKFKQGRRCYECGIKKNSGKNHGNYNHNITDEERNHDRRYTGYKKWRLQTYKNNNYTCQKCSTPGKNLNAHHIKNYAENKELRTNLNNGITLCRNCHNKFHKKYGKKDNNQKQLNEFLTI